MKILGLAIIFLPLSAFAQCEKCSQPPGESIDFCFTHPDFPETCALFSLDVPHFYLENKKSKTPAPRQFNLPAAGTSRHTWLQTLAADKKLKMPASELLFINLALEKWDLWQAINKWDAQLLAPGWTLRPSGLAYRVLVNGTGKMPQAGKKVSVHYTGWLADGKKFDSSLDRKQSFGFLLAQRQVIQGWDEGVALFPVGSRVLLRIPPELGYGAKGFPPAIPPNSVLYFEIQILSAE